MSEWRYGASPWLRKSFVLFGVPFKAQATVPGELSSPHLASQDGQLFTSVGPRYERGNVVIGKGLLLTGAKNAGTKVIDSTNWRGIGGETRWRGDEMGLFLNRSDCCRFEVVLQGQASCLTRCAFTSKTGLLCMYR